MASRTQAGPTASHRWAVFLRIAAAVVPGYAATSAAVVLLTYALPMPRQDALLSANMLSFALYTLLILRAFTTRSAARAWLELSACAVLLAAAAALARHLAGSP